MTVLDADGHVIESYAQMPKFLDEPYPGSIDEIRNRGDLSDAVKTKILAENCRRLYKL